MHHEQDHNGRSLIHGILFLQWTKRSHGILSLNVFEKDFDLRMRFDDGTEATVFFIEESFEFGSVGVNFPCVGGGGEVGGGFIEDGLEFVNVGLGCEEEEWFLFGRFVVGGCLLATATAGCDDVPIEIQFHFHFLLLLSAVENAVPQSLLAHQCIAQQRILQDLIGVGLHALDRQVRQRRRQYRLNNVRLNSTHYQRRRREFGRIGVLSVRLFGRAGLSLFGRSAHAHDGKLIWRVAFGSSAVECRRWLSC
mmetsp:Transcript_13131/g.27874  ORF Transcript_13131/g.27874 Transcript_13131/m.27874 type:complete len:251 (+) Transcript_13131:972-1724(+)